jgi:hypothetical protein
MILTLTFYFLAGVAYDILLTLYYMAVTEKRVGSSFVWSVIANLYSYTIIYFLILSPNFVYQLISYSIGGGIGTALITYYKKKKELDILKLK